MEKQTEKKVKVFIPVEKRKYGKQNLSRGFWVNEAGRIETDLINCRDYNQSINGFYYENLFFNYLDNLKQIKTNGKTQEAIFYKVGNQGFIYYGRGKIEALNKRIIKEVLRVNLKEAIREALKHYSGVTIYKETGRFYLEVFFND